MLQPKKKIVKTPVVKNPVRKKPITPVDDYKTMKDPATGKKGTMGGEGTRPPFTPEERKKMPKVGNMGSAKNGKSFPDLNKDGKITRADILKGRGVIAKKGVTIKKAQNGVKTKDSTAYFSKQEKLFKDKIKGKKLLPNSTESKETKKYLKNYLNMVTAKGNKERQSLKGKPGYDANGIQNIDTRSANYVGKKKNGGPVKKMAKSGTSMKKCRYGCK